MKRSRKVPTMLTIKEAAALVEGLTPYRVRQMCINNEIPYIKAGKKYLINQDRFLEYLQCDIPEDTEELDEEQTDFMRMGM